MIETIIVGIAALLIGGSRHVDSNEDVAEVACRQHPQGGRSGGEGPKGQKDARSQGEIFDIEK